MDNVGDCSLVPPDASNVCNYSIHSYAPVMPNFCTLAGIGGNDTRSNWCSKMSNSDEWKTGPASEGEVGSCNYNDGYPYEQQLGHCCSCPNVDVIYLCCPILGANLRCQRQAFTGDPISCCFNNYNCGYQDIKCFSDLARQNTCSDGSDGRNYRDITSSDCKDVLFNYCTGTLPGDDYDSTTWLNRWTVPTSGGNSCYDALKYNIFSNDNEQFPNCQKGLDSIPGLCNIPIASPISNSGLFWSQSLITSVMKHYQDNGYIIGAPPNSPSYNQFEDFLYNKVCCAYPGVCPSSLRNICLIHTAQRISSQPNLMNWCGCSLPSAEYDTYNNLYNIPRECSPSCNRPSIIPQTTVNNVPITCKQTVCIIDDITVNIVNSQISGGIDFAQICGNCGDGGCTCIIDNNTVDVNNSTINGQFIPIGEGCGTTNCISANDTSMGPDKVATTCSNQTNPFEQYQEQIDQKEASSRRWGALITFIIIVIIIIIISLFIYFGRRKK